MWDSEWGEVLEEVWVLASGAAERERFESGRAMISSSSRCVSIMELLI